MFVCGRSFLWNNPTIERPNHFHISRVYLKKKNVNREKQSGLVDSVEHHVESSTDYIKQGHFELKQAEMYQSKARKVLYNLGFIIEQPIF